ncbi:MAG: NAD(P)H-dependent oxidoreductase [Elusimicrobiales bacterium]|nr:NAD(P)H-dependent oxidoreductase [Elusimicrobiales bacterium]
MRKVFGYIGSPAKANSNTLKVAQMLGEELLLRDRKISCEFLTAGDVPLKPCSGCWDCMTKGICPLDKTDGMGLLRQKMLDADFLVWGSPVYAMTVSGQMKIFLDRLCAFYHTLRFAGKPGLTVATTARTGLRQTHELLAMLMCAAGAHSVAKLEAYGYMSGHLTDEKDARKAARETADKVYPYVTGERLVESTPKMEKIFPAIRDGIATQFLEGDYQYWKENGMLDCKSYAELLALVRRRKSAAKN